MCIKQSISQTWCIVCYAFTNVCILSTHVRIHYIFKWLEKNVQWLADWLVDLSYVIVTTLTFLTLLISILSYIHIFTVPLFHAHTFVNMHIHDVFNRRIQKLHSISRLHVVLFPSIFSDEKESEEIWNANYLA